MVKGKILQGKKSAHFILSPGKFTLGEKWGKIVIYYDTTDLIWLKAGRSISGHYKISTVFFKNAVFLKTYQCGNVHVWWGHYFGHFVFIWSGKSKEKVPVCEFWFKWYLWEPCLNQFVYKELSKPTGRVDIINSLDLNLHVFLSPEKLTLKIIPVLSLCTVW